MGFWDKFKSDHIESIESSEDSLGLIVWKFPRNNKLVKSGANVTVRENQYVIMSHQMETGDAFGPGVHALTNYNIPGLISTPTWNYGVNGPFKIEAFFINHNHLSEIDWKATSPFNIIDPIAGLIEASCSGTLSIAIVDPRMFFDHILTADRNVLSDEEIREKLACMISNDLITIIEGLKEPANFLVNDTEGLGEQMVKSLGDKYLKFGFRLNQVKVGIVELPPDVRSEMEHYAASQIKFIQAEENIAIDSSAIELEVPVQSFVEDEVSSVEVPAVHVEVVLNEATSLHENEMDSISWESSVIPAVDEVVPVELLEEEEERNETEISLTDEESISELELVPAIESEEILVVEEPSPDICMESSVDKSSDEIAVKVQADDHNEHKYFVAIGAETKGPYNLNELLSLVVSKSVHFNSLTWRKGLPEWQTLDSIPELKGLVSEVVIISEGVVIEEGKVSNYVSQFSSVEE